MAVRHSAAVRLAHGHDEGVKLIEELGASGWGC